MTYLDYLTDWLLMNPTKVLTTLLVSLALLLAAIVFYFFPAKTRNRMRGDWWESEPPGESGESIANRNPFIK